MNINEKDWKLFKKLIPIWQERFMARLNNEYIKILSQEDSPSQNFWKLYEKINKDVNLTGVKVKMARSCMFENILLLLKDGAISFNDLNDFSDELKEAISYILSQNNKENYVKIKVSLTDCPTRLYRVFAVDKSLTLEELGFLILYSFNCEFEHMYFFKDKELTYEAKAWVDEAFFDNEVYYGDYTIVDVVLDSKNSFRLEYDLGEGWIFDIKVYKKEYEVDTSSPIVCLEGHGDRLWEDMRYEFLNYLAKGYTNDDIKPWNAPDDYEVSNFDNELDLDEMNMMLEDGLELFYSYKK